MKEKSIEMAEISSRFGDVIDMTASMDVAVLQEGVTKAYVISPSRYQSLQTRRLPDTGESQVLAEEYKQMAACMQTSEHANAVDRLMSASAAELSAFFSKERN